MHYDYPFLKILLMALGAFPLLERRVRDLVQQPLAFRGVRLVTSATVGAFRGDHLVGVLQGLVADVMALPAKLLTLA